MFDTTKLQKFESNSQHNDSIEITRLRCSTPQNYKNLKAIPNGLKFLQYLIAGVRHHKITKIWKQFPTKAVKFLPPELVFDTTKLQKFESNSQLFWPPQSSPARCSTPQNYKNLKAIPNCACLSAMRSRGVRHHKITKIWKQFPTRTWRRTSICTVFDTTKLQKFESNSQQI